MMAIIKPPSYSFLRNMNAPQNCWIIDPDEKWQKVFSAFLEKLDVQSIESFEEVENAHDQYETDQPDLILFDIQGPESVKGLKSFSKDCDGVGKIIAISTIAKKETVLDCINGGAFHYIVKSDDVQNMFSSLSTAIRKTSFKNRQNSAFKPQQVASFFTSGTSRE